MLFVLRWQLHACYAWSNNSLDAPRRISVSTHTMCVDRARAVLLSNTLRILRAAYLRERKTPSLHACEMLTMPLANMPSPLVVTQHSIVTQKCTRSHIDYRLPGGVSAKLLCVHACLWVFYTSQLTSLVCAEKPNMKYVTTKDAQHCDGMAAV